MHVTIIGGGIAGLATAFYFQEKSREQGRDVQYAFLESSDRWGGKIATETVEGFLIEGGCCTFDMGLRHPYPTATPFILLGHPLLFPVINQ